MTATLPGGYGQRRGASRWYQILGLALAERSLLAMARGDWSQAEALAGQVGAALGRIGMENLLACAVQARVAMHRGDIPRAPASWSAPSGCGPC